MRKLLYTILELEIWNQGATCRFCSNLYSEDNKAVCQIRTRSKVTHSIVANNYACENCKEKFENDELPKCSCGRLKTRYTCDCKEEGTREKELPPAPYESQTTFYERQINSLQEQLNTAEWTIQEEREAHEDFMEKSEKWSKWQKEELLDRIKDLDVKIKQLEVENKRLKELISQELINEVEPYKEEVTRLKIQLEKLNSQQSAQIEVRKWPWLKIMK